MKLGDFFSTAAHANPVNPKPVTFTCVAKGATLPGGAKNPSKNPVRARVTGAFVFVDGEQTAELRKATRKAIEARAAAGLEDDETPDRPDATDFNQELTYQILALAVREYDEASKTAGEPLFASADLARELVLFKEADRVVGLYNEYVAEEHPEGAPSDKTFRKARR